MKNYKLLITYLIGVIIIFAGIMTYIRLDNDRLIPKNFYRHWSQDYVVTKDNYAYVNTTPQKTRGTALSEGQGYGMLITAIAAKHGYTDKQSFDRLYRYYLDHRDNINGEPTELMSWKQTVQDNSITIEKNSATDGDIYIAKSLLMAHELWPQDKRYLVQAKAICLDILEYEYNPKNQMLTVGDWANSKSDYYNLMRTSDVTPGFFEEFYQVTRDKTWLKIKDKMLTYLNQLSNHNKSGLVPDFAWVKNGKAVAVKGKVTGSKYDGDYYFNACRVPMHLATTNSPLAKKTLYRMLNFFKKQQTITAGYTLSGKSLNDYQSPVFSAPIFLAVMNNKNKNYDQLFQSQQYILLDNLSPTDYYSATLTTLVALLNHK
ncbi:endo-1,4-beta-D-glucanase Y [Lactobacillus colini]|uniref:Glucanase n=1 Tax=Lactobacillus colini TaxID=1819254 RepID=A0ABS4MF99_9LACO|nr:glycosyl hydrolase family 8 [Lactobacillus colini]MBP2058334.1 endo-1,4-beta-D-glucanase Y [Lactobacillus colini]